MLRELDYRQSVETMSKDLKELGVSLWHSFKASANSKIRRRNKQARFLGWQWKSSKDTSTKQWFKKYNFWIWRIKFWLRRNRNIDRTININALNFLFIPIVFVSKDAVSF